MKNVVVDISHIPFSRYGAYMSVTREFTPENKLANELTVHTCRRRFHESPLFTISFGKNGTDDFTCSATPVVLTVKNKDGYANIYFRDDDTLVVESFGLPVCIRQLCKGYGTFTGENTFRLIAAERSLQSTISVPCGIPVLNGPFIDYINDVTRNHKTDLNVACENGHIVMALTVSDKEPKKIPLPIITKNEIAEIGTEWEKFLSKMPVVHTKDSKTEDFALLTWYNLWSCFVRAEGCYVEDTILMTKKQLTSIWSWDHCFNALAMSYLTDTNDAKRIALAQFNAPFVLQSEHGVLPDFWNPDLTTYWATTKPPIHGWCFSKLMDRFDFTESELRDFYKKLSKWTRWWTDYNDTDSDGIPDYPQGNDSGWDNATMFDLGFFVETPDLPAYLIMQMKTLSRISKALNESENADYWNNKAEDLLTRFIEHSWTGERFVGKVSRSHEYEEEPTCLLSIMPLILGDILPMDIREKLVATLKKDFLTKNGIASEMPASLKYDSDGYWRGPIWAPTTYLLVDGLRRGGYSDLANEIARRYCHMSCDIARGNYENFDALTGIGHCAPGHTWTASIYMLLYWEYGC